MYGCVERKITRERGGYDRECFLTCSDLKSSLFSIDIYASGEEIHTSLQVRHSLMHSTRAYLYSFIVDEGINSFGSSLVVCLVHLGTEFGPEIKHNPCKHKTKKPFSAQ